MQAYLLFHYLMDYLNPIMVQRYESYSEKWNKPHRIIGRIYNEFASWYSVSGFYLRIADGSQSSYCWTRIPGMIKTLLLVHSIKRWLASVLWPIIYRVFFIMVNVKSNRQLECLHLYSTKNALSFLTGIRWRTRCNYVPRSLCSPTT